ncbi:MFS transporter [Nocardiopsis alba]|uniref:MFS transporter n=1 Tax=Nocardiopsis alba TaxID=53437 RepID=UPI0033A260BE
MTILNTRVSGTRAGRLTAPAYAYAFLEEFILLYPVYALLFTDTGLTVPQISVLFVLWALTSVTLTVPAGALADVIPRRYLLAAAPVVTGTGFALWTLFPSPWIFALGFVLWGAGGALSSGAFEALVYTELEHRGLEDRYARIMGVTRALGVSAVGSATLLAVPAMSQGGYPLVGAASVTACALCALAALFLPEHRTRSTSDGDEDDETPGYRRTLILGLTEVRDDRAVRAAVLLVILVSAFWGSLDEYVPLLAEDSGVATEDVPLVLMVVWIGVTLGGLLAGPASRLPHPFLSALLVSAAVAIAAGALLTDPVGWVLLAFGFGVCQMMIVVSDARLQDSITGDSRATVTSLADLGTEGLGTSTYLVYAGVFTVLGHGAAFALFATPHLVAALFLARMGRSRAKGRAPAASPKATGGTGENPKTS